MSVNHLPSLGFLICKESHPSKGLKEKPIEDVFQHLIQELFICFNITITQSFKNLILLLYTKI